MSQKNELFISYIANNSDLFEHGIVNEISHYFSVQGYHVIADNVDVIYGGKIEPFLVNMKAGKFVLLLINEKYLNLEVCNYEIFSIVNNSLPWERLYVLVLPDVVGYGTINIIDCQYYWSEKIANLGINLHKIANTAYKDLILSKQLFYRTIQLFFTNVTIFSTTVFIENETNISEVNMALSNVFYNQYLLDKEFESNIKKPFYLNAIPYISPKNVFGRNLYLKEIVSRFTKSSMVLVKSELSGAGKTTILKVFINDEAYFNVYQHIIWIQVSENLLDSFVSQVRKILNDTPGYEEVDLSTRLKLLVKELTIMPGKNLLVIDNANEFDNLMIIKNLFNNSGWDILVSSQVITEYSNTIDLPVLDDKVANQLFTKFYSKESNSTIVKFILSAFDNHPLLIELYARIAAFYDWLNSIQLYKIVKKAMYLKLEISSPKLYKKLLPSHILEKENRVYLFLYSLLNEDKFSAVEITILRYFALMPSVEILESQLFAFFAFDNLHYSVIIDGFNKLTARGWIYYNNQSYILHSVVQPVILYKFKPDCDNCTYLIQYLIKEIGFERNGNQFNYNKLLGYSESVLACIAGGNPQLAILAYIVAGYYKSKDNFLVSLKYFHKLLEINEQVYGAYHEETAKTLNEISVLYGILGNYQSDLEFGLRSLSIRQKIHPTHSPLLSESFNNIAITYRFLNQYDKAVEYHIMDIGLCEKIYHQNHTSTGYSYFESAVTYYYAKKYTQALQHIKKAIYIWEHAADSDSEELKKARDICNMIEKRFF